jgi:hypothetical protein
MTKPARSSCFEHTCKLRGIVQHFGSRPRCRANRGAAMNLKLIGAVGATILLGATTANATVTFFSDFASFSAAAPTYETISIPDVGDFLYIGSGDASVTYGGVTFSQSASLSNGNFFNVSFGFSGNRAVVSSQQQSTGVPNILITLPSSATAFALDYGTFDASDVTFMLSDGSTTSLPSIASVSYATSSFFGVIDTTGLTSVQLTEADTADVLFVNGVSSVPEPSSWAMMLLGFAGIGFAGWRVRRSVRLVARFTQVEG